MSQAPVRCVSLRGATTVTCNTKESMTEAVWELLEQLEQQNPGVPHRVVQVLFSVTKDLNAVFPATIARGRLGWEQISMLDVQHMDVVGSLPRCIRCQILVEQTQGVKEVVHVYLRDACTLRSDRTALACDVIRDTMKPVAKS